MLSTILSSVFHRMSEDKDDVKIASVSLPTLILMKIYPRVPDYSGYKKLEELGDKIVNITESVDILMDSLTPYFISLLPSFSEISVDNLKDRIVRYQVEKYPKKLKKDSVIHVDQTVTSIYNIISSIVYSYTSTDTELCLLSLLRPNAEVTHLGTAELRVITDKDRERIPKRYQAFTAFVRLHYDDKLWDKVDKALHIVNSYYPMVDIDNMRKTLRSYIFSWG
jgi:hypothetical protein